jgi:hypothetical protein
MNPFQSFPFALTIDLCDRCCDRSASFMRGVRSRRGKRDECDGGYISSMCDS